MPDLPRRPRRLRSSPAIRAMVRETRLTPDRLVLPLFLCEGTNVSHPIAAIPGRSRTSPDLAIRESEAALKLGINSVCLFPQVPDDRKARDGREALRENNLLLRTIASLK